MGIYCCPRMGWLTTNFNLTNDNTDNCPDLEYVEFDIIEFEDWQNEYEKDSPKFVLQERTVEHNHDLGDEHMNRIIFEYLKPIAREIGDEFNIRILLQMLDSEQIELMKNEA